MALFPLASVLLPGALFDLRIFEPRYLDLVRECTREDRAFGVCLILAGQEVGAPAVPAAVGTLARIIDFHTLPDGLLGIRVQGGARFRVMHTRVRDNGLLHGEVALCTKDIAQPLPPEYALLATILERLLERIGGFADAYERALLDDACWVGWRLTEHLPLPATERQHLLQLDEPIARLAALTRLLSRIQSE
ncbi:MAG: LON peptidase substrate-binding domain-containing protein [Dokdonella sp.]|nr:LON peptidase substrate-binding domain-containing protein [Dokdonella sp.]